MPFTQEQQKQANSYILAPRLDPEGLSKVADAKALNGLQQLLVNEISLDDEESRGRLNLVKSDLESLIKENNLDYDIALRTIRLMMDIHLDGSSFLEMCIKLAANLENVGCFHLLEKLYGVNWHYKIDTPFGYCTALHFIAGTRGTKIVEFWRKQKNGDGLNIDVLDTMGATPLFYAARVNAIEMVRYLLMNRADINAKSFDTTTPLMRAARSEYAGLDMLHVLMEHGADVNAEAREDDHTYTVLDSAITSRVVEKVRLLLENGARASKESYEIARMGRNDTAICALLDDYGPAGHAEIDNILDNLRRPHILREALLTPSDKSGPNSTLLIPDLVNIIVRDAHQEGVTTDDKSVQKGSAISRIARVRQALQEDLPALLADGTITAAEQIAAKDEIINKLQNAGLRAECHAYWQQRQALAPGQDVAAIVLPWAQYKVDVLKTAFPSENKGMGETSTTTVSSQSSTGHLEISDAKGVAAEAKGMPRTNPVPAEQTPRDNQVFSNAAALHTRGIGLHSHTIQKPDAKPKKSDAIQSDTPSQPESDADGSNDPKIG